MKYCLKVLIPDVFASFLLRDKGSLKDELQQESESRLVFSNKGDFFPDTQLRVLGVYSDVSDGVTRALDLILGKMREHCAEDESVRRQPPPGCEMVGKEEGELILRLVLSREMTGLLIGSQGANIKELRRDSGCKINIRDDAVAAHRLTTLMGSPEQLQMALQKLAENMKTEAETESEEFNTINVSSISVKKAQVGATAREALDLVMEVVQRAVDILPTRTLGQMSQAALDSWARIWIPCLLEQLSYPIRLVALCRRSWFLPSLVDLVTSFGASKNALEPRWTSRAKGSKATGKWSVLAHWYASMPPTV